MRKKLSKKPGRIKRFVGKFVMNSVIASVTNDGFPSWVTDDEKHMNVVEPTAPLEPLERNSKMKATSGWKTMLFGAAVSILGIADSAQITSLLAEHPGWWTVAIGFVIMALRVVTSTPVFKKD